MTREDAATLDPPPAGKSASVSVPRPPSTPRARPSAPRPAQGAKVPPPPPPKGRPPKADPPASAAKGSPSAPGATASPSAQEASTVEPARARADRALKSRENESTQEIRLRTTPSLPPSAEQAEEPFARFGRFDLLGRIATGGMAEILLARESMEGGSGSRHAIIKAVRGEFSEDGDFAEMFLNEGRLAMRLTHPNICTVYECGRHAGRFFIAMEYVHGQTLRDVLVRATRDERRLPVPVLLRVFALVAEALDFAHRARDSRGRKLAIVHRDVSPHNIMIRYDGVVKLLDFGVAKAEHSQHSTQSGALKGKFSYMSPEQALGNPIDGRADVFALGVCMFEAITGRRLFHRKAQYDTLKAILETEPPPLCAFRDDVPDRLEEIVARALAKEPEERYQRAADLSRELDELLTDMREVASTARIGELMEDIFAEEARRPPPLEVDDDLRQRYAPPPPATLAPSPLRYKVPLVAGLAALIVAVAGAGLWIGLGGDGSRAPEHATEAVHATDPEPVDPPREEGATAVRAPAAPEPPPEPAVPSEPSVPAASDGTLPAQPAEPAVETSAHEPTRTEEASPASTRTSRRSPARGSHDRRRTVIVTDPGF